MSITNVFNSNSLNRLLNIIPSRKDTLNDASQSQHDAKFINVAVKPDYTKVAVLVTKNDNDLLQQYKDKLQQIGKSVVEFSLGKNNKSIEQSFLRLKKQGIKLITVCSEELLEKSPNKKIRLNTKWEKRLNKRELIYICPDNIFGNDLATVGIMTKQKPNEQELRDIALGVYTLNNLLNNKNGQAVIVQNNKVLGIESEAETTIDLIERCIDLKPTCKGGILFKGTKPNQQGNLDFPIIDLKTIQDAYSAKLAGVSVNATLCRIINMEKVIKFANRKKIFIIGV